MFQLIKWNTPLTDYPLESYYTRVLNEVILNTQSPTTYTEVIDGREYTVTVLRSQFNRPVRRSQLVSTRYNGRTQNLR